MYGRKYAVRSRPLYNENAKTWSNVYPAATPVTHILLNFIAVAVDIQENWIYYSDVRKDVIYRAHPDGTGNDFLLGSLRDQWCYY